MGRPETDHFVQWLRSALRSGRARSATEEAVDDHATRLQLQTFAAFCILQSRTHEIWARFFGSSLEDRLRYTPSDCFETFPFPDGWDTDRSLEAAGRSYYEHRAALMVENDEGMTKTYNRFNEIYETDLRIVELRELHAAMDRVVLDAYGWADIATDCEFLLDHEIDEATWGRKKKPYRYRWPDPARDEVLARLLALNAERAADEAGRSAPDVRTRRRETQPQARRRRVAQAPDSVRPRSDADFNE